jgi:hypothetical protein
LSDISNKNFIHFKDYRYIYREIIVSGFLRCFEGSCPERKEERKKERKPVLPLKGASLAFIIMTSNMEAWQDENLRCVLFSSQRLQIFEVMAVEAPLKLAKT